MARQKVVIGVGPNGEVEVEGVGFTDNSCFEKTKAYEEALGMTKNTTNKPEAKRKARRKAKKKVQAGVPAGYCG